MLGAETPGTIGGGPTEPPGLMPPEPGMLGNPATGYRDRLRPVPPVSRTFMPFGYCEPMIESMWPALLVGPEPDFDRMGEKLFRRIEKIPVG